MYHFFYILRHYLYLAFVFACLVVSGRLNPVSAFSEDFTSDPTGNPNWLVQNGVGLTFDSPGITLTSSNSGSFPYLKTSSLVDISSDTHYEVTFQYLFTGSPWGVGGSFTDNAPNYPTYLGTISDYLSYNIAYFWGDKLHSVTSLCPISNSVCPNTWWFIYPNQSPSNTYSSSTISDYFVHTFKMVRTSVDTDSYSYKIYMDENLIFESKPTTRVVNSIWLGHPSDIGGSKSWPILKIFSVRSYPDTPVSSPAFPFLSQKDPLWANTEYDSASQWAGVDKSGIDRWGCALTSAAMVLQNYGVKDLNGNEMRPDWLNEWLKSEPDGYIGPGYVNWLAIARYARGRATGGKSLEFVRSYDPTTVEFPAILGLPGHFVVAHDENVTNWKVNDPNFAVGDTDLTKTTTILSINRYVLSSTDLSSMLFVAKPGIITTLKTGDGSTVPLNWIEEYLDDDVGGTPAPSILTAMLGKPASGRYILTVNNTTDSEKIVETYLYDAEGGVSEDSLTIPPLTEAMYVIEYSTSPNQNGPITLDYTSIFDYLKSLRIPKSQANGVFQAIYTKFYDLVTAETTGSAVNKFVSLQSPRLINYETKTRLQNYIRLIEEN